MRKLLFTLFSLFSITASAQTANLKGHVTYREEKSDFVGACIFLIKEGKVITDCLTDKNGNFEFKDIRDGSYTLRLKYRDFKEKLVPNVVVTASMKNLEIVYPDPCIPADKICPYGHKDNIIPIVYGMPGAET